MLLTLLVIPWLSGKRARQLKIKVDREQSALLSTFYDYKEGYPLNHGITSNVNSILKHMIIACIYEK